MCETRLKFFFFLNFNVKFVIFNGKDLRNISQIETKQSGDVFFFIYETFMCKVSRFIFLHVNKKNVFFNVNVFYFLIDVFHSEHSVFRKFYFMSETDRIEHFS